MRGLTHRWIVPDPAPSEPGTQSDLEPLALRFLQARGMGDASARASFIDPKLTSMHDPSLLPGLEQAASRILEAARSGQHIVIYGDYDVDGVTASAILYHVVCAVCPDARISTYVPHRLEEGYGLNASAIESLIDEGAGLIVTVDCGITAHEPAALVRSRGVDLIITDHHRPSADGAPLPDAHAIVHPGLPPGDYPFADLCGAGVAFKIAWRIAQRASGAERVSDKLRELLLDLLALAALGTIADVVPLVDENRLIARFGLRRLRTSSLPGVQALLHESGLAGQKVDAEQVGFVLAPRLNAIGRLGHAREAVELLTTATPEQASRIARSLAQANVQRQQTERRIVEQADEMAGEHGMTEEGCLAIVLGHEHWHPGVVGICCSRLVARHSRPTILLQLQEDHCVGSGRSVDAFDMHDALHACRAHLDRFGGHSMAAGLSLQRSKLETFVSDFTSFANEKLNGVDLTPRIEVDCQATISELSPLATRQLQDLGPFGRGNPAPRILLRGVRLGRPAQPFGSRGAHVSVFVGDAQHEIRLIGWRWGERCASFRSGTVIDAVVEPKLNTWNGRTRVEPTLCDVRLDSQVASCEVS